MRRKIKNFLLGTCLLVNYYSASQDISQIGKPKAVKFYGSVGVGGWVYNHSGSDLEKRGVPFSWYLNGSPTLQLYSFTFPFSFTVSEQQRDFSQPFNQYGVSPYYKWFTAHIGYRNMMFSQYTMTGQTFLGGGIEINPGILRFGAMYGRFRKAVSFDTSHSDYSLPNLFPTYKRMGAAAKIGIGRKANFFDLILFKGWDDEHSLSLPDSIIGSTPGENICLGLKMNFNPFKNCIIDIDAGASALTIDKRRTDSESDLQSQIPQFINNLIVVNYGTHLYFGGQAGVSYSFKKFRIRGQYKYVEPDFETYGSNYIQGDLQDITLSPSVSFAKGKLNLSTTIGRRNDNLFGYKKGTTTRTLLNANINATVSKNFGFGLQYGNFGTSQQNGRVLLNDSVRVSTINQNMGGNVRFQSIKSNTTKMLLCMVNLSVMDDRNEVTKGFTQSNVIVSSINYSFNNSKKKYGYSFSVMGSKVISRNNSVLSFGPNIGLNVTNKKQNLKLNLSTGIQFRNSNNKSDGTIANLSGDLSYSINKKNTLTSGVNIIKNTGSNISSYSFNEQRLTVRYMYSF
ncbi:MAG: hypothetical protein ACKVQB_00630 [Bacteroidia bacterium]